MRWLLGGLAGSLAACALAAPAALADGPKAELVRLQDQCDAATFNAQFGPGFCQRTGSGVTFSEFASQLNPKDFGHNAWWINASGGRNGITKLDEGDSLHVVNEGGIAHTFTRVQEFGGGCIPQFSDPLLLTRRTPAECGAAFTTSFVPQGTSIDIDASTLTPGTYRFQCFFHPWMRQTVEVRPRSS